MGVAPGTDGSLLECSQRARHTVLNPHAASTRRLYSCKWKMFFDWCSFHSVDSLYYPLGWVLDSMQHHLDPGTSPFTVKVYVGVLTAQRSEFGISFGSDCLIVAFLKGANRLCPPGGLQSPTWDLIMVLDSMCQTLFEPILESKVKWLFLSIALGHYY